MEEEEESECQEPVRGQKTDDAEFNNAWNSYDKLDFLKRFYF